MNENSSRNLEGARIMRIEAYNKINEIYKTNKPAAVKQAVKAGGKDEVQISQSGRDYQLAKQAVLDAPDVREDFINDIKSRIEAGTYEVSGNDFASKVIAKYKEQIL